MAVVPGNLERSLPVPSVQELAIQQLETVPPRYIRDDMDEITTVDDSLRVPLIDMTKLVNPKSQEIIDYGVPNESLINMRKQAQEFFDLPIQEKKRWAQKPGSLEGYGQAFVTSEEQNLEGNDMIFLKTLPLEIRNLSLWPENPKKMRETLETYSEDMRNVAVSVITFMALALKLDAQEICKTYEEGIYDMRINCYPPCPEPERVIGIVPHADNSGITLLFDCGNTPGLQVLKDGQWVSVEPIDGAVVVNIGNILEIISNGIYKAPYNRAVVNRLKQRQSVVTFCYPNSAATIGPAKELTNSGSSPLYKTVTREDYLHYFSTWKRDVPFIESLKI